MGFSEYWLQPDNNDNNTGRTGSTSQNTPTTKDTSIFTDRTDNNKPSNKNTLFSIFTPKQKPEEIKEVEINNKTIKVYHDKNVKIDDFQSELSLTEQELQEKVILALSNDAAMARNLLSRQNNGVISDLYNKYKEWKDDDLSLSNVEEAVVLQQEGVDNLQKAKSGQLSKREYFIQNREHLKTMMKRRLFRKDANTGLDFLDRNRGNMTKEEFEKIMEDYINYQINQIEKLDSLKNAQKILLIMPDTKLEELLLKYKKEVEKYTLSEDKNQKPIDLMGQQIFTPDKTHMPVIPQEYDTTESMTFEETFKYERHQEYSKTNIENYLNHEEKVKYAIDKDAEYQNCMNNGDIHAQYNRESGNNIEAYQQIYKETIADITKDIFGCDNFQDKIKQLASEALTLRDNAFGDDFATELVNTMMKDNKTLVRRVSDGTQLIGLCTTLVGGVLCLTPVAPLGAAMVSTGNTLAIGGMVAESVLGYTEAFTRDFYDENEIKELSNNLLINAGGFIVGMKAGQAGMKAFNKVIDKKLAKVFTTQMSQGNRTEALKQVFTNPEYLKNFMQAAGVKISADFLISYAGDLAISGILGTDDNWLTLLQSNLIGIAAGMSGDIKDIGHLSMKSNPVNDGIDNSINNNFLSKTADSKSQNQNETSYTNELTEYREYLNMVFGSNPLKYQQVMDKAEVCFQYYGIKVEFEDVQGEYGAVLTEIHKELNNFITINGLNAPAKIIIQKGEKTEVYWDKNTNEITYVIGDKVKSDDIRYSLRHELVHGNDTKPQLEDNFPDSFKKENLDEYVKEMLKAGLIPDEIVYAFQNRKEFLSIASQGDVTKYKGLKQVLIDCGMPEEVLSMPLADDPGIKEGYPNRKIDYSNEELNDLAQQTITKINENGGIGYKPSEDKLHVWNEYDSSQRHHINSAGQIDHVAEHFHYDTNNAPQPLATLFDRGSYNPRTRIRTVGSYNFNSSSLVGKTGAPPLAEKFVTIERSGSRRGKNSVETEVEHTIEHPEYEAIFNINGEDVEVTYYGYDNDGGTSIYRIKQVKRGNITCNFDTQKSGNVIPVLIDDSARAAGTKVKKPTKEELDRLNKEFITSATGICWESSGYNGIKMLDANRGIKVNGEMCAVNGRTSGRNIHKNYDVDYELKITEESGFGNSRWFGKSKEISDKNGNISGYEINFNVYSYDSH